LNEIPTKSYQCYGAASACGNFLLNGDFLLFKDMIIKELIEGDVFSCWVDDAGSEFNKFSRASCKYTRKVMFYSATLDQHEKSQ
jgi:hypothetical protein